MSLVKIAIVDEDGKYVTKLAAYLSRNKKESLRVMGYTRKELAKKDILEKKIEIVISTDLLLIKQVRKEKETIRGIWLTKDKRECEKDKSDEITTIYQYGSAKRIKDKLEEMVTKSRTGLSERKPFVGVYSPVGRCGKTTFAMEIIDREEYKKWIYIGMEDYSSFLLEDKEALFLYYLKERNKEALLAIIEKENRKIPSSFSFLDMKQIDIEDLEWLRNIVEKETFYEGVLFDIGTGMVTDLSFLMWFDYLLLPYLEEERQENKLKNFCELLNAMNMEENMEHFLFINMGNKQEIRLMQDKIGYINLE